MQSKDEVKNLALACGFKLTQQVERLKAERVEMQVHIDNLLEQVSEMTALSAELYEYTLGLGEPVDIYVCKSQDFIDGYNRARECAHHNLLEIMGKVWDEQL